MRRSPAERLQKVLARAGIGSRRSCEDLIRAGRVTVNGRVASLGAQVDHESDTVCIDDVAIPLDPELVYIALHKPVGVVTTARDTHGRTIITDLVPAQPRVFPVGRLDRDTSGLILLTNDGDFANRVSHPRYGVPKTYVATVRGRVDRGRLRRLTAGVELEDGTARAASARTLASSTDRTLIELVVGEGRNRFVRRLLAEVGLDIDELTRTAVGTIALGRLKPGQWRQIKRSEVLELLRIATA